jgi:hypothetical protein
VTSGTPPGNPGVSGRWRWAAGVLTAVVVVLALVVILNAASSSGPAIADLPPADAPPLEYVDLDAHKVATYVGQLEDGLATTEQRTAQLTHSINASISGGPLAQIGGSEQSQVGTQATVTPTAADLFYAFMRLLRAGGEAHCTPLPADVPGGGGKCDPRGCNGRSRTRWLGEVDAQWSEEAVTEQLSCIGVGNFVRIAHVQMFLPPYAQALRRAQSAQAVYGELPAPRMAFTSPIQSTSVRAGLGSYASLVGSDPRLPFVAAPYGSRDQIGSGVTFFVPVDYRGLTTEPSLLSGSVTVVGKIIYYAPGGASYIDYPTIEQFGGPLLKESKHFLDSIGVCSSVAPAGAMASPTGAGSTSSSCTSPQRILDAIKASVTFRPPVVVVLPVAVYQ